MQARPRPPVRVVAPLVGAVLVLCVLGVRSHVRRVEVERRAGAVASELVGRPVRVDCPGVISRHVVFEDNDGAVRFSAQGVPDSETRLSAATCDGLRRVFDRGAALDLECLYWNCSAADTRAARAVAVLAHESVHMRGIADEGAAECDAQDVVAQAAVRLGLTPRSAASLAHWMATDYAELLPDRYRACAAANAS